MPTTGKGNGADCPGCHGVMITTGIPGLYPGRAQVTNSFWLLLTESWPGFMAHNGLISLPCKRLLLHHVRRCCAGAPLTCNAVIPSLSVPSGHQEYGTRTWGSIRRRYDSMYALQVQPRMYTGLAHPPTSPTHTSGDDSRTCDNDIVCIAPPGLGVVCVPLARALVHANQHPMFRIAHT